jgi:hypothetical protein
MLSQVGTDCRYFGRWLQTLEGHRTFACHCPALNEPECPGATSLVSCATCSHHSPLVFPQFEIVSGFTTSPRPGGVSYLDKAWLSAHAAGLNPRELWADHGREFGPFGSFYMVATLLALKHPHASAYGIFQDDVRFAGEIAPTVADSIECTPAALACVKDWFAFRGRLPLQPIPPPRVMTLYHAPWLDEMKARPTFDWNQTATGWNSPGACAYAFSPEGLRDFLTDPVVLAHRRQGPGGGWRDIDAVVGVWAEKFGGIWFYREPMAFHIGEVSTIERGDNGT